MCTSGVINGKNLRRPDRRASSRKGAGDLGVNDLAYAPDDSATADYLYYSGCKGPQRLPTPIG
jgi:hypothetical protein